MMEMAMVTGRLQLASHIDELEGKTVLLVQTQEKELAALDLAGANLGDRVLVSQRSQQRLLACAVDTAVVAIVEYANCS